MNNKLSDDLLKMATNTCCSNQALLELQASNIDLNKFSNLINIQDIVDVIAEKYQRPMTILEIGAFAGSTTEKWLNCKNLNVETIYAVDPWDPEIDEKNKDVCVKDYGKQMKFAETAFYLKFSADSRVVKVKGTIDTFIQKFNGVDIDIVWLDGANDEKCILNDIIKTLKYVKPKIAVCGHDFTQDIPPNWNAVVNVFPWKKEFDPESAVDIKFNDTSWLVWTDKELKFNDIDLNVLFSNFKRS